MWNVVLTCILRSTCWVVDAWFHACSFNRKIMKVSNRNQKKYRYLAISTSSSISISITYILFLTKLQKRQNLQKGFALIEKRYHRFWTGFWDCKYIAEIKSRIIEKAESNDPASLNVFEIILMFLVLAFYRVGFSCSCPIFFQEYVEYMRIDAFQCLNVFLHYRQLCFSY